MTFNGDLQADSLKMSIELFDQTE